MDTDDILKALAEATDKALLEMAESGIMKGRDSEGNEIEVPVSAMMWGQIIRRLKDCNMTRDLSNAPQDSIVGRIAQSLGEGAGKLPPMNELPDAATG